MQWFKEFKEKGWKPSREVYHKIAQMLIKVRELKAAILLFEDMTDDGITPNTDSFTIILKGLRSTQQDSRLVVKILSKMERVIEAEEYQLTLIFFHTILEVCI